MGCRFGDILSGIYFLLSMMFFIWLCMSCGFVDLLLGFSFFLRKYSYKIVLLCNGI